MIDLKILIKKINYKFIVLKFKLLKKIFNHLLK